MRPLFFFLPLVRERFARLLLAVTAFLLTLLAGSVARAAEPTSVVDLYTIGPTSDFPSRFGHSLVCARPASDDRVEVGACYDYGVADRDDIGHVIWTAIRGVPSFVPVKVKEAAAIGFFRDQGRQIEKQRLPLSAEETEQLLVGLEDDVTQRRAYAYHPYYANCSTKLRDHLDRATAGRLHAGPATYPKGTFREYMEEGHSGHVDILTAMALYLGEASDRTPTAWEAMLLPAVLRDGVTERLGVAPATIEERIAFVLPTSRTVGRIAILLLAFATFLAIRIAARRRRLGIASKIAGAVLGGLAVTIDLVAALSSWPELSRNWALLLFLPTDLAIPFVRSRRWLVLYLRVRIALAILVAVLEIAGVAHQPMLPLAALVGLPLVGLLSALRSEDREAQKAAEAPSRETAAA